MSQEVSPYSNYDILRSAGELHWTGRTWLVLSHAAVSEGLSHPSLSARRVDLLFPEGTADQEFTELRETLRAWTFFGDVTDVRAERKFIWDQLGPKALGNLGDLVAARTVSALATAKPLRTLDVLRDLTMPIRIAISQVFLELGSVGEDELRSACAEADLVFGFITGAAQAVKASEASASMTKIKATLSKSTLFSKTEISKERVLDQLTLLLVVSVFIEKAIANVMTVLLSKPEAWSALKAGEEASMVREALRLESPTQVTSRVALHDFEWRGQAIKAGDQVSLVIGSANRDASVFADAASFLVTRLDSKPLTFGLGGKRCPGEWMTGAIVEEVFRSLLKVTSQEGSQVPKIQEITWITNPESRRPTKLIVQI